MWKAGFGGPAGQENERFIEALGLWQPVALPPVHGPKSIQKIEENERVMELRLAFQNTGGWRTRHGKVAAIGRQFAGDLNIYGTSGWDLAGFAECHCDGYGDVGSFSERVNPEGRSWFTHWLAIHAGPSLAGVDIQTTSYACGRIVRLDMELNGRKRTYMYVYAPSKSVQRRPFLKSFQNAMPTGRDVIIMGDFNTRLSKKDHSGDRPPNTGSAEWEHIRKVNQTQDVWRTRNPQAREYTWHTNPVARTRIDWLEATAWSADEITKISYHRAAAMCGDHSVVIAIQKFRERQPSPLPTMHPAIVNAGGFVMQVQRLVKLKTDTYMAAADTNKAWEDLLADIVELYDAHATQMKSAKHGLLRKLQRQLDREQKECTHRGQMDADKTHARLSLEMEREAASHGAERQLYDEEWGEKPTQKFFQQATLTHRTGQIDKLYRHTLDDQGRLHVDRTKTDSIDEEGGTGRIAASLTAYWQSIYKCTTDAKTPIEKVKADYPASMCLRPDEKLALGADFTTMDVATAIDGLATKRSTFGIIAEVYKGAREELAPLLAMQLNYARKHGHLTDEQRQGSLSLLFKKGDRLDAAMYRPVAVLRADFKIAALILTKRLDPHLSTICAADQTGFIKHRFIHENVLRLRDGMRYAQHANIDAAVLSTDYMKAYDMVQHDVLFAIAATVGGIGYESWLRTLYIGHTRIIVINGTKAPPIRLHSGVPQGCCHACQAFLIFIEGLAHRIRNTADIVGIPMPDGSTLLSVRYADDCQYVVQTSSLEALLDIIDGWCGEVGMKLHPTKTEAAFWGRRRRDTDVWHPDQYTHDGNDTRQQQLMLDADPKHFINMKVYRAFDGVTNAGTILSTDKDITTGRTLWSAQYDDGYVTDLEHAEMVNYVIKCIDGREPGHKHQKPAPRRGGRHTDTVYDATQHRVTWLAPDTSIHVLGMDVGYAVTSASVWTGIARKIHARLAMWGRVRLGFRTRVLVIKTMAYSLVWYLGSLWECPPQIRAIIKAAATYFFWKGRMPQGVMPGDPVSAYRCGTPVGAQWLAADVADGGFGLWDASLQLQALVAQWTHRLVKPAGPNERLWRSPILHWINESLGVTNAADVLLVADKPIERSPMATPAEGRHVPEQWRASIRAYAQLFHDSMKCMAIQPHTTLDVMTQPLFHNWRMAGLHGAPLVEAWSGCTNGRWQPWAANGIDRIEHLYTADPTGYAPKTLADLRADAEMTAILAGKPGMQVGSLVAIQPDEDQLGLTTQPLWLATVVTAVTASRRSQTVKVRWWEGEWNTHSMTLGPVMDNVAQQSMRCTVRRTTGQSKQLTLTTMERARLIETGRSSPRRWRYPHGELQQQEYDDLHAAIRRARWMPLLAQQPIRTQCGDWFVSVDVATTRLPDVILYTVAATTATVDVLTYRRHGEGFRPDRESSRHRQVELRRITVTDGDGELASAGDHDAPSGETIRLLGFGGCTLRPQSNIMRFTVSSGRKMLQAAAAGGYAGVIPPIIQTAAAVNLDESDACTALALTSKSKWPQATTSFWWRNAANAYARNFSQQIWLCPCCADAGVHTERSVIHTAGECPTWHALWTWTQRACRDIRMPIPDDVKRSQWILFGTGVEPAQPKTSVHMAIWGAGLHAIRSLTHGLEQDGKRILPGAAVQVAKQNILKIARADLWWIRNRSDWLRDGGAAVTSRVTTKAAWTAKWKGLARLAPAETDGLAATRGGALE